MTDIDRYLTDAVEAGVQALRAAGLADADGDGFVLEGVYAHGAITIALEAALPDIIQQAKAEAWEEGHAAGCADPYARYGECGCGPNPYRADQIEAGR